MLVGTGECGCFIMCNWVDLLMHCRYLQGVTQHYLLLKAERLQPSAVFLNCIKMGLRRGDLGLCLCGVFFFFCAVGFPLEGMAKQCAPTQLCLISYYLRNKKTSLPII